MQFAVLLSACGNGRSMLLALLLLLVGLAAAAAVPTSVLAQNSELSTNANNKLQQQQQQLQQQQQQQQQLRELPTVKRAGDATTGATVSPTDKKSSPEIVPATFSNAPARSSPNEHQQQAGHYALPSNDEILAAVAAAAQSREQQLQGEPTALEEAVASSTMRKRGINYDYNPYMNAAANDYGSDVPNGVWAEDYEPAAPINYNGYNSYNNERELQDLDDYVPERHVNTASGRNKAYDNLQNLLKAEAYLESIPLSLPLTFANRNYNLDERNKRGIYYNLAGANAPSENLNLNKYRRYGDMRLKRDSTKLTPADMLALVALVEAGERARKETDVEESGISVPVVDAEEMDYVPAGSWLDAPVQHQQQQQPQQQQQQQAPALVDYYGVPVEAQVVPKYEYVPRPQKYTSSNSRLGSSKRFMVSKKKRSISQNQFVNEPVGERGPNYYGEKFY